MRSQNTLKWLKLELNDGSLIVYGRMNWDKNRFKDKSEYGEELGRVDRLTEREFVYNDNYWTILEKSYYEGTVPLKRFLILLKVFDVTGSYVLPWTLRPNKESLLKKSCLLNTELVSLSLFQLTFSRQW